MTRLLGAVVLGSLVLLGGGVARGQSQADESAIRRAAAAEPAPRVYDLKLAVETALRRHPALTAAGARSQAAQSGIASAGAQYRPTIETQASVTHTIVGDRNVLFRDGVGSQSVTNGTPYWTHVVGLIVPVVREGALPFMTLPSELVARSRYDTVKLAERLSRSEVVGRVSVAFFTALAAREEVALSEKLVELNRVLYDNARLRFEQQLIAQAEVLAAESALFSATADLEAARAILSGSINAFLNSVGAEPASMVAADVVLVDRDEPPLALAPLPDLLRQVSTNHPAVLVQEAKVKEASAARKKLRTERYPTVDAVLGVGAVDDFASPVDGWSMRASLRLNWKIFDFGALSLKLKEQEDVEQAERTTLEEIRNAVGQPVITAYRNLAGSRARITAAEKTVDLAEELARAARQRYEQNLLPVSEVLRAETNVATARRALIQARNTVRIDHALLQVALGTE